MIKIRPKTSQDAPRSTDGHVSKKSPRTTARATTLEDNHRHPAARVRKKENEQGKGIVYLQHSGVECNSTAEGHPRGKMASGRLWLRSPAQNRSVGSSPRSAVIN